MSIIQEYLNYLEEISAGTADLVANLAGAKTGTRLALNLAFKGWKKLQSMLRSEKDKQKRAILAKKINIAQQKVNKLRDQFGD